MSAWLQANRWAFIALPITVAVFVIAVWFFAIRPTVVANGGTATKFGIGDTIMVGTTTLTNLSVQYQLPAAAEPMTGTEVMAFTVESEQGDDAMYLCHIELTRNGDPRLTFRPTSLDVGLTGDAAYASNCIGSDTKAIEYLVFLIPEGLTGDFSLRFLDPDQPVEVDFAR